MHTYTCMCAQALIDTPILPSSVCPRIHSPTHLSLLSSLHLCLQPPLPTLPASIYLVLHSCICQTTHSSIFGLPPFLPLSIHPISHQSLHPFINSLIHPLFHPSMYASSPPFIPSTHPSGHPFHQPIFLSDLTLLKMQTRNQNNVPEVDKDKNFHLLPIFPPFLFLLTSLCAYSFPCSITLSPLPQGSYGNENKMGPESW